MRTNAPRIVKTALALRGLLFFGGVLAGAVLLLAAGTGKKATPQTSPFQRPSR